MNEDVITQITLTNPKTQFNFRVIVQEDREELFTKLMESNGFKFTKISEFKQAAITIDLNRLVREDK